MKSRNYKLGLFCWSVLTMMSCHKMDVKPKQSLVVPTTLQDMQGILDDGDDLNVNFCSLGEIGSDNYYLTAANYNSVTIIQQKKLYTWSSNIFDGVTFESDWNNSYFKVFYANVVLDGMEKIVPSASTQADYNNIKGQALFHRAHSFYMLSQEFAKPFDMNNASFDLSIPLRLSSDLNIPSERSSVKDTYDRIIGDLTIAKRLLPNIAQYKLRPSKAAAFGLLARAYLSKGDYSNALLNADSCLRINNSLINYNSLNSALSYPLTQLNNEVIFQGTYAASILTTSRAIIPDALYQSFDNNDLRKSIFFSNNNNGTFGFKGSYNGTANLYFAGIATDEIYLIRAECYARLGQTSQAIADLNTLLVNRYRNGSFVPVIASTSDDALMKIVSERRKELLFRGLRWSDLRRLNLDPKFSITLTRSVGTDTYSLPPNDPRYTLPIPTYVTDLGGF